MKNARQEYRFSTKDIKMMCYADDAILISDNEDDLQRMAHAFKLAAKKYNMKISTSKTKVLVVARKPKRCKIVINN